MKMMQLSRLAFSMILDLSQLYLFLSQVQSGFSVLA